LPPKSFLFGGRTFSWQENLGYFYDSSMKVFSARKSGEVVGSWASVEEMLQAEWEESVRIERETRERLAKVIEQADRHQK
jgi:hypothetical protein